MPPTLFSPRQIGEKLGHSYEEVLHWTRSGLIPCIKVSGRYYYDFGKVVKALHERAADQPQEAEAQTCAS